jgi:TRAP-type C4-dicarboxylate transport system permease small subunit
MAKPVMIIEKIDFGMLVLSWIFVVLIFITTLIDVILRDLFETGMGALYSSVELLIACVVFCGLAYSQKLEEHISVKLFVERLTPGWQHVLRMFSLCLSLIIGVLITYRSWIGAVDAYRIGDVTSSEPEIYLWPAKTIMAAGLTLWCLEIVKLIITGMLRRNPS